MVQHYLDFQNNNTKKRSINVPVDFHFRRTGGALRRVPAVSDSLAGGSLVQHLIWKHHVGHDPPRKSSMLSFPSQI